MRQKTVAILLTLIVCVSAVLYNGYEVKAEDAGQDMDFSYLMTDDALIGYTQMQTRGVYLAEGYSIINKISSTKIGAGGITNAALKCKVSVCPIVERLVNGTWGYVTSWTVTNANDYSAMASRSITVGTGYTYRVRCLHYASSDSSTSWTDGLKM